MEYFWIRQDNRYIHTPIIKDFYQTMRRQNFVTDKAYRIPDYNVVFCDTDKEWDRIDVLDCQVFLVSDLVRHVFCMYEKEIRYKFFCCLNNRTGEYMNYYAPIFPQVDCLEEIKTSRIKREKIGDFSIFQIKNPDREMTAVRLDVAESLLRRRVKGIEWQRLVLV